MIAVLFVQLGGVYYDRTQLDLWPEAHDARLYSGSYPVVAHPPCARWCQLAPLNQALHGQRVGDDNGCFAFALATVRRCGGVLEHPAFTLAWEAHGLVRPKRSAWFKTAPNEWVCEVSQAAYGHRARKLTWLVYVGKQPPPELDWSRPTASAMVSSCWRDHRPDMPRLSKREASATPPKFADALIALAEHSRCQRTTQTGTSP